MADPTLPPGACDCHVHVIGPRAVYPMVDERHYTPPEASAAQLQAHLAGLGLARAVIVQPSVYGTDNRCLLASLAALDGAARGVAVLDDAASDADIDRLDAAGVRGLRINLESASVQAPEVMAALLEAWAGRVAHRGWHLQVYARFDVIAAAAPRLRRLPVPLVLDHFAMVPVDAAAEDARVQAVRALLTDGPGYIKLSAPYRVGGDTAAGADALAGLAHTLVAARPDRLLWGSDWPHTNREAGKAPHETSRYRTIEPARLLADLLAWLPEPALRQRVLVDNPARLYAF